VKVVAQRTARGGPASSQGLHWEVVVLDDAGNCFKVIEAFQKPGEAETCGRWQANRMQVPFELVKKAR
jgi:hypothetical protein